MEIFVLKKKKKKKTRRQTVRGHGVEKIECRLKGEKVEISVNFTIDEGYEYFVFLYDFVRKGSKRERHFVFKYHRGEDEICDLYNRCR